jgi:hypothetical protein
MKAKKTIFLLLTAALLAFLPRLFPAAGLSGQAFAAGSSGSPIRIIEQPSSAAVPVGTKVVFRVRTDGGVRHYQWEVSKDGGNTWSNSGMPGNTSATLVVEMIESRDGYCFRCVVRGADETLVSVPAELRLGEVQYAITTQPADLACAEGQNALFYVEAGQNALRYQWQTSTDGGKTWADSVSPGSQSDTMSVGVTRERHNYRFRCILTGENGAILSESAALTVYGFSRLSDSDMNLQMSLPNRSDMMWSFHLNMNQIVVSYKGVNDKIYWGYTSQDGYAGVASYDINTGETVKTHLKHSAADDHNNTSLFMKDGRLIVSYSTGHNTGNTMNFRVSSGIESVESFQPVFQHVSDGTTCYGQLFEYGDSLFCFFRHNNTNWHCVSSNDAGYVWGDERQIITAPMQYYCKIQETSVAGLLRLCMYSNPDGADPTIRMGFLDLNDGLIYNSDAATVLGSWEEGVEYALFDPLIIPAQTQRLFDVDVTEPQNPSVLIAQFAKSSSDNARYCWFHDGRITEICDAGENLLHYSYQNGIAFCGPDRAVLSRSDRLNAENGKDYIEIWSLGDYPSLEKLIYSEEKGSLPIRNFRPIVDPDRKAILWLRGYYNPKVYTSFKADVMIYLIDQDRIV